MSKAIVALAVVVLFGNAKANNSTDGMVTGSIRLVGSEYHDYSGIVEIFANSTWGRVCADWMWDETDASVVCRQLGYPGGAYRVLPWWQFAYEASGPYHYSQVQCSGSEAALSECEHVEAGDGCEWQGPAAVECYHEGSLRLVDGNSKYDGRVEIFHDNEWGSICYDDSWHFFEMNAVCKQLGFALVNSSASSFAGIDDWPIHLTGVECHSGYETALSQCDNYVLGTGNCSTQAVVRISCYSHFTSKGTSLLATGTMFTVLAAFLLALVYV